MVMVGWSLAPSWQADDAKQRVLARLITRMVGQNLDDPYIDQFPGYYIVPGLQGATLTCVAILKEGQESSASASHAASSTSSRTSPTSATKTTSKWPSDRAG